MSENTDRNIQVIENASSDDIRPGDYVIWEWVWERRDTIRAERVEGVAHHRDTYGNWHTVRGMWVAGAAGERTTLTIRRPISKEN